jgi:multiple sugar transport system ATP-binding protein
VAIRESNDRVGHRTACPVLAWIRRRNTKLLVMRWKIPDDMGRLQLKAATKQYEDVVAVDEISLDIADGEFVSLVGPSGCGKSTTLEMIGGLTMPTGGTVHIAGRDVTDKPPKDRNIAMVFQNIALFPHMDVYDNISYGLRLRKMDTDEVGERVDQAAEILQLEGMLDRMPAELSGGQRQRVAIGRAIVRDPDVFLMDEPLANLDAKLRVHMRTELQRIQRELDVTTVYVTHDQEEAMTMSDRIAILNQGELQQIAPPMDCYDRPANVFVAGFIGSPSMNFFRGKLTAGGVETGNFVLPTRGAHVDDLETGSSITLGIRPEDVYQSTETGAADQPTDPIPATVDVLEPVGSETFVYLLPETELAATSRLEEVEDIDAHGEQLLMRTESHVDFDEGDRVEVVFDRETLHLFDGETGEAVAHGLEEASPAVSP